MTFLTLLLLALVGVGAGVLGGLLGISGGLITVPALLVIFTYMDFPPAYIMHLSIGTSLAAMVVNSFSSTMAHHQREAVMWKLIFTLIPGLILGAICGAFVARGLTSKTLQDLFGIFVTLLGIYMLFSRLKQSHDSPQLPPGPLLSLLGFFIAALSSFLGIGGGSLIVPALLACKVKIGHAIGTSAAMGFIITTIGALSYLSFGYGKDTTPFSIGYLYIPAFIMLSVATFISAPYGAKLAHHLPALLLKRLFAIALIATGILMLIK